MLSVLQINSTEGRDYQRLISLPNRVEREAHIIFLKDGCDLSGYYMMSFEELEVLTEAMEERGRNTFLRAVENEWSTANGLPCRIFKLHPSEPVHADVEAHALFEGGGGVGRTTVLTLRRIAMTPSHVILIGLAIIGTISVLVASE
jgi:hypothetical protein